MVSYKHLIKVNNRDTRTGLLGTGFLLTYSQKQLVRRFSIRIAVQENFIKFTGKYFFSKVAVADTACFPVTFPKFLEHRQTTASATIKAMLKVTTKVLEQLVKYLQGYK